MASVEDLGGNKYKIYVELGYNDSGKRIRRTKTVTVTSPRDLKNQVRDFELKCHNGPLDNIDSSTFEMFVERWFDLYVKADLSYRSYDTYYNTVMNNLVPYFGKMKMANIKTIHIVEYLKNERDNERKNLSGKYGVLCSIFSRAVKWEVIEKSPMEKVDKPLTEKRKREKDFYDEDELKHLFAVLDKSYPKHRIAIKLAAIVGLRRSEILGIRYEALNFKDNTIFIDRVLHYDKFQKVFKFGPTKNKVPRTVDVPEKFMKEIRVFFLDHKQLKWKCGSAWNPMIDADGSSVDLLFTNEIGYPNHLNSLPNEWQKIVKRYGLPHLNFHGLRHSCASYMVSKGVNFKIIQEQLGHSDIKLTINTYSHLTERDKKSAISYFEDIL